MEKSGFRWLFFVFASFMTFGSVAQEKIVMVTESWPPFRMDDATDPSGFVGIDIDVIRYLEKALSIKIEIQRHPWARALEMMKNGQADCITGFAYSLERAEYSSYVPTPYYAVKPVFYALKGKGSTVRKYEDLSGKRIGQSKNSMYFDPYNSDTRLLKVDLTAEVQILQMLSLGRLDLAIGTEPNIGWDVSRLGLKGALEPTAWQPPEKTDLFIAFSKKSPAVRLVPSIDKAVIKMLADGTMDAIVAKYR